MIVILIPLLIITFLFTRLPKDHPVTVVDWKPVLAKARSEAPFPVLGPTNLPGEWRVTRATWIKQGQTDNNGQAAAANRWQLAVLSPDDVYFGLVQTDQTAGDLIGNETRAGASDGQSTVGGTVWQRRVSTDDRTRSLVLQANAVTTIVTGDTSYTGLEAFASSLTSS